METPRIEKSNKIDPVTTVQDAIGKDMLIILS